MRGSKGVLAMVVLLASGVVLAEEGRIPIYEPVVLDAGAGNISGSYVVTRDITSAGAPVIQVVNGSSLERLDIDLNGFTLAVSGMPADVISVSNVDVVHITNGVIAALPGGDGIRINNSFRAQIDRMTISGGDQGIELYRVIDFRLDHNDLLDNASGIYSSAVGTESSGVIRDNRVRNAGSLGIGVSEVSTISVLDNRVESADGNGIQLSPGGVAEVAGNHVYSSGSIGIYLSSTTGCRVSRNIVSGSGRVIGGANGPGIVVGGGFPVAVGTDCLILNNVSTDNTGPGIAVGNSGHLIQGNVINNNRNYGLWFYTSGATTSDNTYGGNTIRRNSCTSFCPCPGGAPSPDLCDTPGNPATNLSIGQNLIGAGPPS